MKIMNEDRKEDLKNQLDKALAGGRGPTAARFALACLSAIPVIGGAIGGVAGFWSEEEQERYNHVFTTWLQLQQDEIKEIGQTIVEVMARLDLTDVEIQKRIESPEYLKLVKKCFRDWSAAESEEKRVLVRNLLANAASTKICSDEVVRMFVSWIDRYSELDFKVIREIYKNPGITRAGVWQNIQGEQVREDSAEADLYKLLYRNLSTGQVIRQHREKDYYGNFMKEKPSRPKGYSDNRMKSAFDDGEQYELTELGKQFVHYTMNEIVLKLTNSSN